MIEHKRALLISPCNIKIERPVMRSPEPYEVHIKKSYAGICSDDISIYRWDYHLTLSIIPGHEFSGKVMEVFIERWKPQTLKMTRSFFAET